MSVSDAARGSETPLAFLNLPEQPRIEGDSLIIPLSAFRRVDTLRRVLDAASPITLPPPSEVPWGYENGPTYEAYARAVVHERTLIAIADAAAALLLDAARMVPFGCAIPALDAEGLVERTARQHGDPSDFPEWDPPKPPKTVRPDKIPSGHLRLHRIAERDGGWNCAHCGIGLIDICTDDDVEYDQKGRRYVKPGVHRELATLDHQVPQSLNGSHEVRNLALACGSCNTRRGANA